MEETKAVEMAANNPLASEDSIYKLLPGPIASACAQHLALNPDLFAYDEHSLSRRLKQSKRPPNPTDNRLRLKFWLEYDMVVAGHRKQMEISQIIAGICDRYFFMAKYLKDPYRVAWLLCPPAGYVTKTEEALEFGLEELRDILALPHYDEVTGKINVSLGELKAKIVAMLDSRVRGAVVSKNLNLNLHAGSKQVAAMTKAMTMDELQKEIQELEERIKKSKNVMQGIEVVPE